MDYLAEYLRNKSFRKRFYENAFHYSFRVSKNTHIDIHVYCSFDEENNQYVEDHTTVSLHTFGRDLSFSQKYTHEKQPHVPIKGILEAAIAWDFVSSHLSSKKSKKERPFLEMDKLALVGDGDILFSLSPSAGLKKLYMRKDLNYAISHAVWYDHYCNQNEQDNFRGFMCKCGVKNKICQCLAAPVFAIAYLPKLLSDFKSYRQEKSKAKKLEKHFITSPSSMPPIKNPALIPTAKNPTLLG